MFNIEDLCKQLNDRVFQYDVLYVDYTGTTTTIKFLPIIKPSLVKKLHFDDLISFVGHSPIFTDRLMRYSKDLSNGEINFTKHFLY